MGHRAWHTFAKLPVCALINDLKKKFRKKLYVTIPQWSEAFRNMSHLRSGWNRAKCGLQLNDPIGWSKLRLNQPKIIVWSCQNYWLNAKLQSIDIQVSNGTCCISLSFYLRNKNVNNISNVTWRRFSTLVIKNHCRSKKLPKQMQNYNQ